MGGLNTVEFKLKDWLPQEPWQGPPLPEFLNIFWPWYKPEAPPGLIGDLNDDGIVDRTDLDILQNYLAGYPIPDISPLSETEFLRRADINGDGAVNILDLTALEALMPTPPGAEFKVSNLVISPTEVQIGYPVSISCTVTNIGSQAGSYTVTLGGDFVAEQTVSLQPGESKTVSFEVTPAVAKTYSVSVDGLTGSFKATTAAVADIRVENLVISPTEVNVGEKVLISVTATNYGTVVGTKTITCTVT